MSDNEQSGRQGLGASLRDRATQASPQAPTGLGHSVSIPSATCDSCRFLGAIYWDNGSVKTHQCRKSSDRRAANFRSSGDFADDFMREFCSFYDARSGQPRCSFYDQRPILPAGRLAMLQTVADAGKEGLVVKFFSEENRLCGEMSDKFVDGGSFAFPQEPARGERRWFITKVGTAELARAASGTSAGTAETEGLGAKPAGPTAESGDAQ